MKQILVFAGTTEGRQLIERLCQYHIQIHACVATEYGKEVLPQSKQITIHAQRMDNTQMETFLSAHSFACVIDATHPYAVEVTQNIQSACANKSVPYLRLLRENSEYENCVFVSNTQECISYLNQTSGTVLLTTGSKELAAYTAVEHFKERLYARVLPMVSVVEQCIALGFQGKHLICMQGPFTVELNQAILKQINANYMVTKDSGSNGGLDEKLEAARKANVIPIVIGRPTKETGYSLEQLIQKLVQDFTLQKKEKDVIPYFPFFCNIKNKRILVVGGGIIAQRRIQTLLHFGCQITMITPECTDLLKQHVEQKRITACFRTYQADDCASFDIVLAATNNHTVNEAIVMECKTHQIPVNACHCKELCDFYFPAVVQQDNVVIGVTSSGVHHKQAGRIAEHITHIKTQLLKEGGACCE
ncbi:MAG: precorrin-6A reductase [Acutalibacteraceae bacterium]|nr:precorrin-6A reductase [Acutalibacteraceae bacterium]